MGVETHEAWLQSLSRSMGLCSRVSVVLPAEPSPFNDSVQLGGQRAASTRTNVLTSVLQDMPTSRLRLVRSHGIGLASGASDGVALAHANPPACVVLLNLDDLAIGGESLMLDEVKGWICAPLYPTTLQA
ncbi:hypothetical protein PCL_04022 [Purpureocillium lilacinum]|uniref:Uncharacterized protein n=2 Tax=Purpureocillium lilacinum TaxID=33203 RepID=A0A2U3EQQ2_PURLI|nr:hypothetical protein Purlil1_3440 [Purpureocillium lilacinum]PWI76828.1 hypothetical protein PCL_04022 [Purpureocillium lilacinum]